MQNVLIYIALTIFIIFQGNQFRDNADCRINGCSVGECIRQGNEFVCRQGKCEYITFLIGCVSSYTHAEIKTKKQKKLTIARTYLMLFKNLNQKLKKIIIIIHCVSNPVCLTRQLKSHVG